MRIFISHSIKNEKIVLTFAEFLESINSEIEVFCSSEKGSIGTGKNFVKTIFDELDACDLFIPVLSREYYGSKSKITCSYNRDRSNFIKKSKYYRNGKHWNIF